MNPIEIILGINLDEAPPTPIPGFSKYKINGMAVITNGDGHALADRINLKTGYRQLQLVNDAGEIKTMQVHLLIALTFRGPRPEGN